MIFLDPPSHSSRYAGPDHRRRQDQLTAVSDVFCSGSRSFLTLSDSSDPVIDLSHESLICNWQTLSEWVNEETRSITIYRQLVQAALQYRDGNTALLLDPALQVALDWREQSPAQCGLG